MSHPGRRLRLLQPAERSAASWSLQSWAATSGARTVVALLLGAQVAVMVGGAVGFVAGAAATAALRRWLARLEPVAVRRRRERVHTDLPLAVDLLVASLRAGRPVVTGLSAVATAVGGPLGADLGRWAARLELGGEPSLVWAQVSADPVLGPVGRAIVRAEDTGAPVADSLQHLVDDLQRDRVIDTEDVARRVAVRSAVPMGLCFLPAFVLVGVTPTVVGAFSTLLG